MALVGYARVSSVGQSLEVQEAALREAGCTKIFAEKKSGRGRADRPALADALEWIREGDTLAVTRVDRLGRSTEDLLAIVRQVTAKGAQFKALEQGEFDTSTSVGELMLTILAAIAKFETMLRAERQRDGIEAAKAKGVYKGRPPSIDAEAIKAALAAGEGPAAVARRLNVARSTVYRLAGSG